MGILSRGSGFAVVATLGLVPASESGAALVTYTRTAINATSVIQQADEHGFPYNPPRTLLSPGDAVTLTIGYSERLMMEINSSLTPGDYGRPGTTNYGPVYTASDFVMTMFGGMTGYGAENLTNLRVINGDPGAGADSITFEGAMRFGRYGTVSRGSISFTDPTGTLLDSKALPSDLSILDGFSAYYAFTVPLNGIRDNYSASGSSGPATAPVPEPPTLAMAGVGGLVGLGGWLRRRRAKAA